jgi:hypothetical protein
MPSNHHQAATLSVAALLLVILLILTPTASGPQPVHARAQEVQTLSDVTAGNTMAATHRVHLPIGLKGPVSRLPIILRLTASPPLIQPGESTTLSWQLLNAADELRLEPDHGEVHGQTSVVVHPAATTVYRLIARNPAGSYTASVQVTVMSPPAITRFRAVPAGPLLPGESTTLQWAVENPVERLTLEPGVGDVTGQGEVEVWPEQTTLYTLLATNAVGSHSAQVTVAVLQAPAITSFTAEPSTVNLGEPATLSWSVTGSAASLLLEPGIGDVTGSTRIDVQPSQTTQYTLTARNAAGSHSAQALVTVIRPPLITSLTAEPSTVNLGELATLSWSVVGSAASLLLEPGIGDVTGSTRIEVQPGQTTQYTLTARNAAGSHSAQVLVTVVQPPLITSFTAEPSTIDLGESTRLSWSVAGSAPSLLLEPGVGDVTGLASLVVSPAETTTYVLTARNSAGSDTKQVQVTVNQPAGDWWDSRWHARVRIEVKGSGYERVDKVVELPINFTQKLQQAGLSGAFDEAMLRVIEVDGAGGVLNEQVPFQFDKDPGYQASSKASGQLVLLAEGLTGSAATRTFYAYFDITANANGKVPASVAPRVSYQDNVSYEGQASYRIVTGNATYYYHKQGAGFASALDRSGADWISYHPTGGAAGNYRGIPNVATTDDQGTNRGLFHPGYTLSNSVVLHSGPIKLTIQSTTVDQAWQKRWEIYPQYARMTLSRKPAEKQYWFLYEGTPGGSISAGDYYVLADGVLRDIYTVINADLAGEEWLYFGDPQRSDVLFIVNHQEDSAPDCHYVMQDSMTVFGFGREYGNANPKYLNALPGYFTFGFLETGSFQAIRRQIRGAYKPVTVSAGSGEGHGP